MNVYLGLDLGSKTCGIALSQSGFIASDLATVYFNPDDYDDCLLKLTPFIVSHKATHIVLGYPKHMNNDVGIRGQISESFKVKLEVAFPDVKIILWDERLSTSSALKMLSDNKKKRDKQKKLKDQMAAQIILQNYLDYQGR